MDNQAFAAMDAKKKGSGPYFTESSRTSIVTTTTDEENMRGDKFQHQHGLHWIITGLFVVGDMAGGGLVALPTAVIQSQFWPGIIISFIMCLATAYTAYALGESWVIMQKRWPEYREHCRKPYAEMGARSLGPRIKAVVSGCIDANQFGTAVVYLLLSAKNIHDSIKAFSGGSVNLNFCFVILILAAFLLPVTFLKSPQDFWWAVVLAMVTTTVAVILICIGGGIDYHTCSPHSELPEFRITNYFLALGTFLFSYGGHAAFPTIQHDMRKPYEFRKSVVLAFTILQTLYLPVGIIGYLTYGDSLRESVINAIQTVWIQQAINILITVHCILTLTIVFNPLNQEVEEVFNVPQHFGVKRVVVRTGMMVAVVFVAESLPTFGPLLDLMGGSTLTLTSLIFPCLFYVYLQAGHEKAKGEKCVPDEILSPRQVLAYAPKRTIIICAAIIVFATIGGGAATFSAIRELSTTQFQYPCYVAPFLHVDMSNNEGGHTTCCGRWSNVTWHQTTESCMEYKPFFN
ncbi:hypothetical protein QR680_005802 [Steinernema hermaphroditum]|uniref:Amino acid transporter transmembrane domain-containing protein n=1 Tax=Steinernema hermaphroditum TaxID=289476 RepID=A0AA39HTD1_9BILA|nr:hypothetical protein QR680_005802 [Steinernema hermaphroditum]